LPILAGFPIVQLIGEMRGFMKSAVKMERRSWGNKKFFFVFQDFSLHI